MGFLNHEQVSRVMKNKGELTIKEMEHQPFSAGESLITDSN